MIRRAQAEALLKLAEALEECERNGVEILWDNDRDRNGVWANQDFTPFYQDEVDGAAVRMAIAKLYPKSED